MINWTKHFMWFLKASKDFLDVGTFRLIAKGGIRKAVSHANYMVWYEKLTDEQKERLYVEEDRIIHFD